MCMPVDAGAVRVHRVIHLLLRSEVEGVEMFYIYSLSLTLCWNN